MTLAKRRDPYLIESVQRAHSVLSAFDSPAQEKSLADIAKVSGLSKSTAFRLLYTLQKCGMVAKVSETTYQSKIVPLRKTSFLIGYSAPANSYTFYKDVHSGLQQAAADAGAQIIYSQNDLSPNIVVNNANSLVRQKPDLIIQFQLNAELAAITAKRYREAEIPVISVDIPNPGTTFYGASNHEAGRIGGSYLGRWADRVWNASVDEIVLITAGFVGRLPQMRLLGTIAGIHSSLPKAANCKIVYLEGGGLFEQSFDVMRNHLAETRARRSLVSAMNDESALGALRAIKEAGREDGCAVMGQNASAEARAELRKPGSRLLGSVAFFPERYGKDLLDLSLEILNGRHVAPANFVTHTLATHRTVDHLYPNDSLLQ